jgi:hypothetical protein
MTGASKPKKGNNDENRDHHRNRHPDPGLRRVPQTGHRPTRLSNERHPMSEQHDNDTILSRDEIKRLLTEITKAAGPEGLTEDQMLKAVDQLRHLRLNATMIEMWDDRMVTLAWDVARQQLRLTLVSELLD